MLDTTTSPAKVGAKPATALEPMLLTFLRNIDARVYFLRSLSDDPKLNADLDEVVRLRAQIESMSAGPESDDAALWVEAYLVESLMVLAEPPDTLLQQLYLRLDEASAENVKAVPRLRASLTAAELRALDTTETPPKFRPSEASALRSLLLNVLAEIHWTKQRKFVARPILKSMTRKIVFAGLGSFGLFLLPYIAAYGWVYLFPKAADWSGFTGLPLWTALTAGLFGAYFSRLLFIQTDGENLSIGGLKAANEWPSILLRGCVGMCGAVVVFIFLRSGMVAGALFPDFGKLTLEDRYISMLDTTSTSSADAAAQLRSILPSAQLALLSMWCFLAGFSERLVPNILSTTEQKFDTAQKGDGK